MNVLTLIVTRFKWFIVSAALLLIIGGGWFGMGVFGTLSQSAAVEVNNTESSEVAEYLDKNFTQEDNDAILLYSAKHGTKVTDQAYQKEVERLTAKLETSSVKNYYTTGEPSFVSRDKTKTYVAVNLKNGTDKEKYDQLTTFRNEMKSDLLSVHTAGWIISNEESTQRIEHDLVMAEAISLPILAILLLFIFRGVIAAALPLLLGVIAIIGGLCMVRLLTHFTDIDQYSVNVITILGLGLSVDYSLLMVARFREELDRKPDVRTAIVHTIQNAGKTIVFSGLIVMASLLSLTLFPISLLRSVGLGGASALLVAMLAALTVLPALLLILGKRINKWRVHLPKRKQKASPWRTVGAFVMKRPIIISAIVIACLLYIASPALQMQFKPADYTILPRESQTYIVYSTFADEFDGGKPSVQVLYTAKDTLLSADGVGRAYDFTHEVQKLKGVTTVDSLTTIDSKFTKETYQQLYLSGQLPPQLAALKAQTVKDDTMIVNVNFEGEVGGKKAQQLVADLRAMNPSGAEIKVGGQSAGQYDLLATIAGSMPSVIAMIAVTMFVLLAVLLRSLLIPLTAILINTFALLTTFGILVWVFQWGNLTGGTWLIHTGGLDVTVPVLVFAMAFGLSMDYGVFLYSRIHEEYLRDKDNVAAILHGLERTGPLITQAALLFFVVVAAFASSGIAILQQIGVGLALAVLLDAFVVRVVFIPAVMKLLGRANWWMPGLKK